MTQKSKHNVLGVLLLGVLGVHNKLPEGLRYATYRWGRKIIHKSLGRAKYSFAGIKKTFTKIEENAVMAECLVRYLAIKEAL